MSTLQIDVDQLKGELNADKATELGVVKTTELTALTTSLTELIDTKEHGYQLIGSVVAATDTAFDLSATTNEVDGVSIPEEGAAFFFGQTDPKENGVYQKMGATNAWTRDPRFDEAAEIKTGNFFIIDQGSHAHDRVVITSTGTGRKKAHVIGTDDITAEVKKRTLATITPIQESGLTTKDVLDTASIGGEATGYTLQKDYDHITHLFIGVTPILAGEVTSAMAFFSADNGVTAKLPGNFKAGDELFVDVSKTKVTFPTGKLVQLTGLKGQHGQMGGKAGVRNNYAPAETPLKNPDGSPLKSPKGKQVYQLHKRFISPNEALVNGVDEALDISYTITSLNQVFFIKADGLYAAAIRGGREKRIATGVNITALEVDTQNRQLYWADQTINAVYRSDFKGQNRVTIGTTGSVTVNDLLVTGDKLYQCLSGGVTISELDGSGKTTLVSGLSGQASGLAIDTASSTVFYGDSAGHAIRKIGFDGSGASNLHTGQFGVKSIVKHQSKLYWITLNTLASSDLDGSNLTTLLTLVDETSAGDLVIDPTREQIYFTRMGRMYRCNLDGSGLTLLNGKMEATTASRITAHLMYAHQENITPFAGEEEFGVISTEVFTFLGNMTLRYSKKSDPVL